MILNTGNRTDIPAFYSRWFYNRIREGFVMVRNPYAPSRVTRYKLDPGLVDVICFCSKDPSPMLPRLHELDAFNQFWFMTITPYGREIEPAVPPVAEALETFRRLSQARGRRGVSWRYDPIFISKKYDLDFHCRAFSRMADELAGYTSQCVISFIDLYEKTRRNFPRARMVTRDERARLGREFAAIAGSHGIRLHTCLEGQDMAAFGIDCSGCMTGRVLERYTGIKLEIPAAAMHARSGCSCVLGNDIGVYNTCAHGCAYCYANYDRDSVARSRKLHDPDSPFLIGGPLDSDIVKDAVQESFIDDQLRMDIY